MTSARHRRRRRRERLRLSLALLSANFVRQNPTRVFGVRRPFRHACRCQKHPWTRMTHRSVSITTSGQPGNSSTWSRNRNPRFASTLRTIRSGPVFWLFTSPIRSERWLKIIVHFRAARLFGEVSRIQRPKQIPCIQPGTPECQKRNQPCFASERFIRVTKYKPRSELAMRAVSDCRSPKMGACGGQ